FLMPGGYHWVEGKSSYISFHIDIISIHEIYWASNCPWPRCVGKGLTMQLKYAVVSSFRKWESINYRFSK
ncbi:hypothetical protein L3073_15840, partial [Ancylomarina sp. DW003]